MSLVASMRPQRFSCGIDWWTGIRFPYFVGFNEAAAFQLRNRAHRMMPLMPSEPLQ